MNAKWLAAPMLMLTTATPALAAPGEMNAATFLQRAEALQARGVMAAFSGDVKVLTAEGQAAGANYRARLRADAAAGRAPHSCPPAQARLNSEQVLAHLRSYPPQQRQSITMNQAMADLFVKTFPCRR